MVAKPLGNEPIGKKFDYLDISWSPLAVPLSGVAAPPVGASLPTPYLPSIGAPTVFPTYPLPNAALGGLPCLPLP